MNEPKTPNEAFEFIESAMLHVLSNPALTSKGAINILNRTLDKIALDMSLADLECFAFGVSFTEANNLYPDLFQYPDGYCFDVGLSDIHQWLDEQMEN